MRVGSLFSGIGGIDLGLERAGMTVAWQSEIEPYCCRVLAKHWPHVPNLGDVTTIDWSQVEPVDLIAGGYPCQPFSLAGTRSGETDPRHLWPRFADALRHLRPRYALLENVPGHLSLGFGRVLGDLADLGYDCEWDCIPAAAVGAPHLRYRVFVVAYPQRDQLRHQPVGIGRGCGTTVARDDGATRPVADTDGERETRRRFQLASGSQGARQVADTNGGRRGQREPSEWSVPVADPGRDVPDTHRARREQQRRCLAAVAELSAAERDGWWSLEPDVGRVADGVPSRVDRLRALGNAVVPQVAELIGRRILEAAA